MTTPGRPDGVNSAVQNADLFTDVSPFWYSATAKAGGGVQVRLNPNFSNGAANAAWAMAQLKGAGLTVLPAIADGSGKGRMASTLADPALRAQHVADIVALVVANGYDGIDLDYEVFAFSDGSSSWGATQPNWTAFVTELGAALKAQGKLLAVTIPPPCNTAGSCGPRSGYWVYNIAGIAPAVDRIRIMAYDYHVNGIGPIAPMPWVRSIVQYSVSVMDPAKLQIGVPTYGRAWTRLDGSKPRLTGTCPTDKGSSAYRSLTAMASVTDREIPALLASVGVTPADIQWSESDQENWVYYDKKVNWTDAAGATQTCTAKRVMWWVGPQAVLARTQLVGEFGLSAAAYWTIGGDDPAQWPLIRSYAQSLAPASTDVTAAGVPALVFGSPMAVSSTVTSQGAPAGRGPGAGPVPAGRRQEEGVDGCPVRRDRAGRGRGLHGHADPDRRLAGRRAARGRPNRGGQCPLHHAGPVPRDRRAQGDEGAAWGPGRRQGLGAPGDARPVHRAADPARREVEERGVAQGERQGPCATGRHGAQGQGQVRLPRGGRGQGEHPRQLVDGDSDPRHEVTASDTQTAGRSNHCSDVKSAEITSPAEAGSPRSSGSDSR